MAWKLSGSGLNFHHLYFAHKRIPEESHVLFTEEHVEMFTVKRSKKLMEPVVT